MDVVYVGLVALLLGVGSRPRCGCASASDPRSRRAPTSTDLRRGRGDLGRAALLSPLRHARAGAVLMLTPNAIPRRTSRSTAGSSCSRQVRSAATWPAVTRASGRRVAERIVGPLERIVYRVVRVDPKEEMTWAALRPGGRRRGAPRRLRPPARAGQPAAKPGQRSVRSRRSVRLRSTPPSASHPTTELAGLRGHAPAT